MTQRGVTLIELLISIIIGITALMIVAGAVGGISGGNNITYGINGMTESRCIENYKFIVGHDGNARQILDEFGKGVKCQKEGM